MNIVPQLPVKINIWTVAISISAFIFLLMSGCPEYSVYCAKKEGESQLAHATYSKQVQVREAAAKMESAALLAQADTIRAHGVARSNEIIGQSLNHNEAYLHWLWIDHLEKANVIYVATEAGIPILEAGHRNELDTSKRN